MIDKFDTSTDDLKSLRDEGIQDIYNAAKKHSFHDETFDKNTTLFICCNEAFGNPDILWQLEEDPYIFKKNIILYSLKKVNELDRLVKGDFSCDNLNKLFNNPDEFEKMKQNGQNSGYALLGRLFVKLPFLTYENANQEPLVDLSEQINAELKKKKLDVFCDAVFKTNWDSIDSYDKLTGILNVIDGGHDD
ncbi:MAG: hypothetical protein JSV88_04750 [Candidatus Aminicenantes bacterium]|nr:MAG: hypothetical protein JSV88_04750 [Candidatus Aminicenantes bacterium]